MKALLILSLLSSSVFANSWLVDRQARLASEVIQNRMISNNRIPDYIAQNAKCVAAIRVVKAGLIWGGQGSTGLVTCRTGYGTNEWSAPSFLNIGGVNFGLQIGIQFMESVVLFMTDAARDVLNRATFKMGADLSFAAGPLGNGTGVGLVPGAHVLTYDRAVGLYAGATINGFVIAHAPRRNAEAYGTPVQPVNILKTPGTVAPSVVQPFLNSVRYYFGN